MANFLLRKDTVVNIKEQQHEWCTYLSIPVAHLPSWFMAVQTVLQQREERYSFCQKFMVLFLLPNNNICRLWKKGLSIFWHIPGSFLCLSGNFLLLLITKQCVSEWARWVHMLVYTQTDLMSTVDPEAELSLTHTSLRATHVVVEWRRQLNYKSWGSDILLVVMNSFNIPQLQNNNSYFLEFICVIIK